MSREVPVSIIDAVVDELLDADAAAAQIESIAARIDGFDQSVAYDVLAEISVRRRAAGWVPVGRKLGFTNTTIWELYGVDRPMWAPMWDHTVRDADGGEAIVELAPFTEPRLEPEVVCKLRSPVPVTDDPVDVLRSVEWIAPGFEIVRSPFPAWRFALADCTAAFGLHGALVVGQPVQVGGADLDDLAARLATFEVTLKRGDEVVDRGIGANVLGSPALALAHLARTVAEQPGAPPLRAGEIVTTGTVTDAQVVAPGETWSSDYGSLGLEGLTITFG